MRVANPRQGDFAEPDRGFKGEGPALARLSHRCDTVGNAPVAIRFPIVVRSGCHFRERCDVAPQCTAERAAGITAPRTRCGRARQRASPVNADRAGLPGKR